MMQIFVEGTEVIITRLSPEAFYPVIEQVVDKAAAIVMEEMKKAAPVRTGRLRESIRIEEISPLHHDVVAGGQEAPYVLFVAFGTRPHIIEPVRAKALHFITDEGEEVFAKRVMHPGYAGYPFHRVAIEFATERFRTELKGLVAEVFRK